MVGDSLCPKAPIGALRLRGPQPVTPWAGVREATSFGSACSQIVGPRLQHAKPGFDENCLYLNIWSPSPDKQLRPAIPLMAGSTRDDIRLFELVPGNKSMPMKRLEIAILLEQQLGKERADKILAAYPANRDGQRSLATDAIFGLPTIQFAVRHAEGRPSWFYRFDAPNPLLGAAHGLDLWYVWNLTGLLGAMMRGGPLLGRRKALAQPYA
jgi:carboxylesterase type B